MPSILVVDDSAMVRAQVRACLEEAGYRVTEAEDGRAALVAASAQPFDLVVTDLHMPGVDGLSLVKELRAKAQYSKTPIFVLTTETDTQVITQGRQAGVTAWVTKPVRADLLLNGVRLVLPTK